MSSFSSPRSLGKACRSHGSSVPKSPQEPRAPDTAPRKSRKEDGGVAGKPSGLGSLPCC